MKLHCIARARRIMLPRYVSIGLYCVKRWRSLTVRRELRRTSMAHFEPTDSASVSASASRLDREEVI